MDPGWERGLQPWQLLAERFRKGSTLFKSWGGQGVLSEGLGFSRAVKMIVLKRLSAAEGRRLKRSRSTQSYRDIALGLWTNLPARGSK